MKLPIVALASTAIRMPPWNTKPRVVVPLANLCNFAASAEPFATKFWGTGWERVDSRSEFSSSFGEKYEGRAKSGASIKERSAIYYLIAWIEFSLS